MNTQPAAAAFGNAIFTPLLIALFAFLLYRGVRGMLFYRSAHQSGRFGLTLVASLFVVLMLVFTITVPT